MEFDELFKRNWNLKIIRQIDELFKRNWNLKIIRQIDLVLHYLAAE